MAAPRRPPTMGAAQKSHSCPSAQSPTKTATPVLRAGFTEVLVTGMLIRWIKVNPVRWHKPSSEPSGRRRGKRQADRCPRGKRRGQYRAAAPAKNQPEGSEKLRAIALHSRLPFNCRKAGSFIRFSQVYYLESQLVRSSTLASGAFFFTDSIPFSMAVLAE